MAFERLITNQVNNAFDLIGDLAEDITFTDVDISTEGRKEYNFASGEIIDTDPNNVVQPTTTVIKGVISRMTKNPNDNTMMTAEVILKTADASIINIDNYDTLRFRRKDWSINSVDDNGFAVTLTVARKV